MSFALCCIQWTSPNGLYMAENLLLSKPSPFATFSSSLTGRSTFQSSLRLQTYRTKVGGLDNLLKSILLHRWNCKIIFIRISQTATNRYEFRFRKREKKLKCMQNYFCGEDSVSSWRTYTNQLLPLENYFIVFKNIRQSLAHSSCVELNLYHQ